MFKGVLTALVTPFRDDTVDEEALENLVELQIEAGVDGLVPCGSSGEAATRDGTRARRSPRWGKGDARVVRRPCLRAV